MNGKRPDRTALSVLINKLGFFRKTKFVLFQFVDPTTIAFTLVVPSFQ
ncbi:hypothetical protein LEP1GSC038_4504 [Leptospira weilii str. 2006001855]|uniref:Uncharacterized protein n=1 Tax=Leptospira weilii str. 2006001855 TaxID=996804 RepID=M6FQ51_9LEPT|nr:hypothetical protein LEP1GSC038_4504 [Leptospira weilii str. 2006001855]